MWLTKADEDGGGVGEAAGWIGGDMATVLWWANKQHYNIGNQRASRLFAIIPARFNMNSDFIQFDMVNSISCELQSFSIP